MFSNLIESSTHAREFKRRGQFFLYTVAGYVLLFTAAGVASIYAYDARLDEQTEQIITILGSAEFPVEERPVNSEPARSSRPLRSDNTVTERQAAVSRTDMPQIVPTTISTKANTQLPVPRGGIYSVTGRDRDGGVSSPLGCESCQPGSGGGPTVIPLNEIPPPSPPVVVSKPTPQIVRKSVLNGEAIDLPKPPYPMLAKTNRVQGSVNVQVLIDETGKVVAAHAVSGSPFLTDVAVRAAYQARFSPTKIGDQAVKVSGTITYNFVLQL